MNSRKFRTIETDRAGKVIFCNPFPERYERTTSRSELVRAWKDESRIREAELFELRNAHG